MTADDADPGPSELAELRARMDALNLELRALLQARARLVRAIGAHKARLGLPAADPARERQMLDALLRDPGAGFPPAALERILRLLFAESRALLTAPE